MRYPRVTIEYQAESEAVLVSLCLDSRQPIRSWRGRYSRKHPRIEPGLYHRSHVVGVHRGRAALSQHGRTPIRLSDGRTGFFGFNVHDDRGDLAGCIGLSASDMLELLGLIDDWRARTGKGDKHPQTGGMLLDLKVLP